MIRINDHFLKLKSSYLFADIARKVKAFQEKNPQMEIIRLGIGDVTQALPPVCVDAFHEAVAEMGHKASFKGYGPEQGYPFLREAIAANDFQARGAQIDAGEIFISDGAKCDTGNIQEIFAQDITVAMPDPVYPVYLDTNVMAGRTGHFQDGRYQGVVYLEGNRKNGFIPDLPDQPVDLIYLCFPNNPTGATIDKAQLQRWVDYAHEQRALILFDAAYEAFIRDDHLPRSIYEIPGAHQVAIEFRSFSKTAGFTGTRCAYTVVPKVCRAWDSSGEVVSVYDLWSRRHSTKFNGVSYPVQRAAAAIYSEQGKNQSLALIDGYLRCAALIRREMTALGYDCIGGENSPYIWMETGDDSWRFFDLLLQKAGVVCTPGVGFGKCGQGYVRLSAFNDYENVEKAMARIRKVLAPGD
jgi:LL-diaminopimelate aminotransferase